MVAGTAPLACSGPCSSLAARHLPCTFPHTANTTPPKQQNPTASKEKPPTICPLVMEVEAVQLESGSAHSYPFVPQSYAPEMQSHSQQSPVHPVGAIEETWNGKSLTHVSGHEPRLRDLRCVMQHKCWAIALFLCRILRSHPTHTYAFCASAAGEPKNVRFESAHTTHGRRYPIRQRRSWHRRKHKAR